MMLALLFLVTFAVALLPMLPALVEWRRPSDVAPLRIEPGDALDPPGLARSFIDRLQNALDDGRLRLGRSAIAHTVTTPSRGAWPLQAGEAAAAYNRRLWHVVGDARLPPGQAFLSEVAAWGALRTARGGVHRALLAGQRIVLADDAVVLRWAHGREVEVGRGCRLAGRVSAEQSLDVRERVRFTLLHAPVVRFTCVDRPDAAVLAAIAAAAAAARASHSAPPAGVAWDRHSGRGIAEASLNVPSARAWRGDLICRGDLRLGTGCQAQGSLKAHGELRLAAGCSVAGSVVARGLVRLKRGCRIGGSVISETAVVLGAGCVVGMPGRPATVAAPRIEVAPGVIVHGTLWAGDHGRTTAGPAQVPAGWAATVQAPLSAAGA